jgi:hypothetical protein
VDLSWAEKQNIACQQVSPYVSQALRYLSPSQYTIDEIAIKVCGRDAECWDAELSMRKADG